MALAGAALTTIAGAAAGTAWGAPEPDLGSEAPRRVLRDLGPVPQEHAVWLEHHGSFRLRPELLLGGDLGAGESPVPAPLAATTGDDADAATLSWASVRLRYEPVLHLGRSLEVGFGIDALDNLVLGSTHEAAVGSFATDLLNDSAASPSAGDNGWADAVRVRYLYGRWRAFDMFDAVVGRMPAHYGLGINRNAGACPDCDFGTIVDAMRLGFTMSGFRVEGSWEWTALGATTTRPGEVGQAKDLGQEDDVSTYTIQLGQRPTSEADWLTRAADLDERHLWVVDWSIFTSLTDQNLSSSEQLASTSLECRPDYVSPSGQQLQDIDCTQLYRRGAVFWKPGAWVKAQYHPEFGTSLRLELELGALIGSIDHPQRLETADSKEAKSFTAFGGAFELEYQTPAFTLGLNAGFGTGDNGDYVGVLDGQNIVDPDDDAYAQNDNVRDNGNVTSYAFNRDYRLDLILFRQILGAVTNAVYVKPWISKDVLQMESATLSVRFDALYALAANPEGTPGNGAQWGVELDGRVGLAFTSGLALELGLGVLIPLDALDNRLTGAAADPAFAAQALATWSF